MDNTTPLKNLVQQFTRENLITFLRAASGSFTPKQDDFTRYAPNEMPVRDFQKQGQMDFKDGRRLIVLAGKLEKELTTHSGKRQQYELAKKVLKDESYDAGIFVFYDNAGHFRFSLIVAQYYGTKREFTNFRRYTYFVSPDSLNRTFLDQIGKADFANIENLVQAFSIEAVTKDFFRDYKEIFDEAEESIKLKWNEEKKRLYTQRFFNRMMFIAFLERKGWMNFNSGKDYLRALFEDYDKNETNKRAASFHRSRLNTLFFRGLNNPHGDQLSKPEFGELKQVIGNVPYLNGGLFDQEEDDIEGPLFPDAIVSHILNDLMYRYNFTVTESTPLDVEVAVDPEMLGKIFEELVTGRHESGSYYTPKPVVSFMCRAALKVYLQTALPSEKEEAITKFVYENDPSLLRNPEAVREALRAVKVCDPACGSGAYLLGMLHELLALHECLSVARSLDSQTIYERKLEIIQNNLYGVDLDPFAVNVARLRLWLSLIVDFEGDNPPPLPNLDFKIEAGDSLTAPDPSGGLQPDMFRQHQVQEFLKLKNDFMSLHAGAEKKKKLGEKIKALRAEIKEWAHPQTLKVSDNSFDWQVDFAEVFAPELAQSTLSGKMVSVVNTTIGQMEMTDPPKEGGFDIVLANPPYVRQELLGDYKEQLKPIYPEVYSGMADLYIYFYARAHQLLRNGGVSCFISSNKWLRAGYGEKLRQHLLDAQAFQLVVDFGELPVFQTAATFPAIFLWQKQTRGETKTKWAVVKNLEECYNEGIFEHVTRISQNLPASQFGKGKARLVLTSRMDHVDKMEKSGRRLSEIVEGQVYRGITTGFNNAFLIDQVVRDELVESEDVNHEIIKPILSGDDIRRYEFHYRKKYLIFTRRGIKISRYPTILKYLAKHRSELSPKSSASAKVGRKPGDYQWYEIQDSTAYYEIFEQPKIISSKLASEPRFVVDNGSYYLMNTTYCIANVDWFLVGALNSSVLADYLRQKLVTLGDPENKGRSEPRTEDLLSCPIPDAPQNERKAVSKLAEQAQKLHAQRRKRVEKFLRDIEIELAESTSRNPLEQPWSLSKEELARRVKGTKNSEVVWRAARDETAAVTEQISLIEKEIDERVKSLYGL